MKKITTLGLIILLALGASLVVYAASNVANTKHNLSTSAGLANRVYRVSTGTNADQVCVFCHTPHSGDQTKGPLWNRSYTEGTFNMYTSSTINMTMGTKPGSTSLACLSCHDGTTAFDSLLNFPGSGSTNPGDWVYNGTRNAITNSATPATYMGPDLTNDHPIAVTYDTAQDTAFNAKTGNYVNANGNNLPLYSGKVECGSCHNPHDNTNGTFLRASNAGSALCTTCHIK
ncbi:MAG: cytochrome c3 family protein [Nitrospirae bacterium]|nr:cytochrome c3 family protein [Nitrospirota bacterium]